jgi:pimeloyl-ACP methyl ester carboxylesterase
MPKLYAGKRPADFDDYRKKVVASLHRPGYTKAFSQTTRTKHDSAEAHLSKVSAPATIIMGESDPDFADPATEAAWIAERLHATVTMVPEAGHYPTPSSPTSPQPC